jgi:hypothetical protein
MSRIPVGATIAHAYRFAFADFLKVASIVWLPWLFLSVGGVLLHAQLLIFSNAMAARDLSGTGSVVAVIGAFYVLTMFLLFMQIAGITEQALGLRRGSPYFYFSIQKPVWRLIGAFLLMALIFVAAYLLLLTAGFLLGIATAVLAKIINMSAAAAGILALVAGFFMVAVFCAYFYCFVRASFLLNPVVIAEQRISLKRSWALGEGNFWRMLVILLAVTVPILVLMAILMLGFLFQSLPPTLPVHATAEEIAANRAIIAAWNTAMMDRIAHYWYIVYPIYGVSAVLFYGLSCGAQCFAYRALVGEETEISASHP